MSEWRDKTINGMARLTETQAIEFMLKCASYFENRPTGGEDKAYWANVFNAEKCRIVSQMLEEAYPPKPSP